MSPGPIDNCLPNVLCEYIMGKIGGFVELFGVDFYTSASLAKALPFCYVLLMALAVLAFAPLIIFSVRRTMSSSRKGFSGKDDTRFPDPEELAYLIRERRSIFPKDFCYGPVDRRVVLAMLEAANWAPTHGRTEPWRFVVLGRSAQEQLCDLTLKVLKRELPPEEYAKKEKKLAGKRTKRLYEGPNFIAICMKRQANPDKLMPEWEEICCSVLRGYRTCGSPATARGAAGYWTSWQAPARDSPEMRAFLGLEPEDRCLGFFILGKCKEPEKYRSLRGPTSQKVVWRLWMPPASQPPSYHPKEVRASLH
eukprot:jgi/Botrbrau1/13195/Bobra.0351s0008.1